MQGMKNFNLDLYNKLSDYTDINICDLRQDDENAIQIFTIFSSIE
jgi:hypothetical protein